MDWLRDHAFLAGWLSLPLMMILAVVQGARVGFEQLNLIRLVLCFALLSCIAAVLTS
jgi:hypothetical protein